MCGFVGKFLIARSEWKNDDLENMMRTICHRGPDSKGVYTDGRVKLGFRRLSIIDTITGDQPLFNEERDLVLVANGEIYNYKNLKNTLEIKGHQFRTRSDCEVIVHLYEEYGSRFIEKLNGMFAFCLYDKRQNKLILGRDRVGIKPLYYAVREGVLIFASEIKAILQATEVEPVENVNILEEYLCFRSLSGYRTFFSKIDLLPPGTFLEVTASHFNTICYWRPEYRDNSPCLTNAAQVIQETLRGSVSRQLMADVPLGAQLSGGVDSSWVSCLAAHEAPGMKSFTVGFSESGFDETAEARAVAKRAGLEYHQIISNPTTFATILPRVIWHNDEPLTHANSVEIYNLCQYAKRHVKVLLTGEGADELFGGYPRYFLPRVGEFYNRLPLIFRPGFRHGLDWVTRGRGKKPSSFLGMVPRDLVFWNAVFVLPTKVSWLMDRDELDLSFRRELLDQSWHEGLDLLDNLLLYELQSYLQPILLRQDKMSMGASVEARVPILDNEMIDLALSFTAAEKMKYLRPKHLFKIAAKRDLPSNIVKKRKIGFGVPVGKWMRGEGPLSGFLDHLHDQRYSLSGINPFKLEQVIREHRENLVDHHDVLWPLLNYVAWRDIFFKKRYPHP